MFKVVVISTLCLIAQASETPIKSGIELLSRKCVNQAHAPSDSFKLLGGRSIPTSEPEQCYLECIYRGMKLVTDDTLNVEVAKTLANARYKSKVDLDNAHRVIDSCSSVKSEAGFKCGLGVAVRKCILDYGRTNNFYLQP